MAQIHFRFLTFDKKKLEKFENWIEEDLLEIWI